MPSRPLQLAGLSLEPVYQQGYLTASAAPEASDSPSGWEGCQQSPWKERQRKRGKKTHNEIRRHHSSEPGVTALFHCHHFGDKNKPNYPWRKGMAWHLWWYLLWDWWHLNDWHISGRAHGYEGPSGIICSKPLVKYLLLITTLWFLIEMCLCNYFHAETSGFGWKQVLILWLRWRLEPLRHHYSVTTNAILITLQ